VKKGPKERGFWAPSAAFWGALQGGRYPLIGVDADPHREPAERQGEGLLLSQKLLYPRTRVLPSGALSPRSRGWQRASVQRRYKARFRFAPGGPASAGVISDVPVKPRKPAIHSPNNAASASANSALSSPRGNRCPQIVGGPLHWLNPWVSSRVRRLSEKPLVQRRSRGSHRCRQS
jgi:hypothetical protein